METGGSTGVRKPNLGNRKSSPIAGDGRNLKAAALAFLGPTKQDYKNVNNKSPAVGDNLYIFQGTGSPSEDYGIDFN